MMKRLILLLCIAFLSAAMVACGSQEEKKMKFFEKGMALYEEGDYVKARLEFKNALQIDPKFARGYYMLGLTEQKAGNFKNAFASFNKAVQLEPERYAKRQALIEKLEVLATKAKEAQGKGQGGGSER